MVVVVGHIVVNYEMVMGGGGGSGDCVGNNEGGGGATVKKFLLLLIFSLPSFSLFSLFCITKSNSGGPGTFFYQFSSNVNFSYI